MIGGVWPADNVLDAWSSALWRASWQGAIALTLTWLVCRAVPRLPPNVRCWLWRLALLKMMLAALVGISVDIPLLPNPGTSPPPAAASLGPVAIAPAEEASLPGKIPSGASSASLGKHPSQSSSTGSPSRASVKAPTFRPGLMILLAVWLAVLAIFLVTVLFRARSARRWRREWRLIKDPNLLTFGEHLAEKMGLFQPPVLFETDSCHSPVVFGAVRTAVVLPARLVVQSTPAEMRLILGHEMAHIRRWDLLGNWFSTVVSAVFFFHPLVWLALRECRLAQEEACDELAVGQPDVSVADYGRLLVDLAARFQSSRLSVVTVGVAESFQVFLKRRLCALKYSGIRPWRIRALAWTLAGAALLGLLPWRLVAKSDANAASASRNSPGKPERALAPQRPRIVEQKTGIQTAARPFTITADRVRRVEGDSLAISAVPSGLPLTDKAAFLDWDRESSLPNLCLDLLVQGPKSNPKHRWFCNVAGPLHALDDLGRPLVSPDQQGVHRLLIRGLDYPEGDGRMTLHLRLPSESRGAKRIRSIEGTLLIAEGKVHCVVFQESDILPLLTRRPNESPKPLTKEFPSKDGKAALILTEIEQAADGLNILLAVPWTPPKKIKQEGSPEYLRILLNAFSRINLTLTDSLGERHTAAYCPGYGPSGEGRGPTISVCDGKVRWTSGLWASRPAYPCSLHRFRNPCLMHQFHFDPLPAGITVKSMTCTITECPDPPQTVPFRLENVPLPGE
jgi:beta-lactamase regulating signal transducer with metallopeptidase domain